MKVKITQIAESELSPGVFNAKCSEITQDDILGRRVYVSFSKMKEVGYELELADKRIQKVLLKATKNKPARSILRYK